MKLVDKYTLDAKNLKSYDFFNNTSNYMEYVKHLRYLKRNLEEQLQNTKDEMKIYDTVMLEK